jgi:hypothetical protein
MATVLEMSSSDLLQLLAAPVKIDIDVSGAG